jgi:putative MFS transporter
MPLLVLLFAGTGGVIAMLSPYAAEVYPTWMRGTGSGYAAASSKVAGIFTPKLAAAALAAHPGFGLIALIAAAPMVVSTVLFALIGIETRDRPLEEVSGAGAPPREPEPELVSPRVGA